MSNNCQFNNLTPEQRFWIYAEPGKNEDDCWKWHGNQNGHGYGRIKVNGESIVAHRYSYMLNVGPIPEGLFICHTCDNRQCTNPRHLFLGTNSDNQKDAVNKGRKIGVRGERNHLSKLTKEDVLDIRKRYKPYRVTAKMLAKEYQIHEDYIHHIVHRDTWKHV